MQHQIKGSQCFFYTRIKQPCPLKLKLCLSNLDFFYGASLATVKLNGEFLQKTRKYNKYAAIYSFYNFWQLLHDSMLFLPQALKRSSVDELKVQGGKYWLKNGLDFSGNFHPTVRRTTLCKMLVIVHNCWFFGSCVSFGCWTEVQTADWEQQLLWIGNRGIAWSAIGPDPWPPPLSLQLRWGGTTQR